MITMFDLMQAFHDIDTYKGRVCKSCDALFYDPSIKGAGCHRGCKPANEKDGCEAFQARATREDRQLYGKF